MAREFAKKFYNSKNWKKTRKAYLESVFYICEKCQRAANIVHHIIELNEENINDANISLDFENLLCVCQDCHNDIHSNKDDRILIFDEQCQLIDIIEKK